MKSLFLALAFTFAFLAITSSAQLAQSITPHFKQWLQDNGYGSFNFDRADISGGSYGGKANDKEKIEREPVIFFHGNSDHAVGVVGDQFNGFTDSISYFLSQGYKTSELYITTWGPANQMLASQQTHSYDYVSYLRNFTEAVLKYTKAKKIDVIAHSMGVTLARKVIRGGSMTDAGTTYQLGDSFAPKVDTFLGISGANLGLVACYLAFSLPTCGKSNGFYPGIAPGPVQLSTYLDDLLKNEVKEGDYVFTMLSTADDLIMYGDKVWGKYTSQITYENDCKIYTNLSHMNMKIQTAQEQLQIITKHAI
jgi:triacylglycerol lipase